VPDAWQEDAAAIVLSVRADGKWSCFEYGEVVPRQNGKGSLLEIRVLAGLFLLEERLIMWSSHEYKTSMESFRRMRQLITRLGKRVSDNMIDVDGIMVKVINTNGEESFERLDTGARVRFIARSKGSGRGFTGDLNIIDEALAYTFMQHEALLPTMSAVKNPQIIYTSTPPLEGDTGEVMFSLKARAEAGGGASFGWRDWGIAGDLDHLDQIDLDDQELWAQANPALGIRITAETVQRERASMGDTGFARERLGIWPAVTMNHQVIDAAAWARLADPDSHRAGGIAIACDVSPLRDWASVVVYGQREDGLGHVQLVDYRPGTDWLVPRLLELRGVLNPAAIGMGRSTAASLAVALEQAGLRRPDDPEHPLAGDLAVTTAGDMAAATGQILDAVRENSFRHVPHKQLDLAVRGARTRQTGDIIAWSRKDADADIGPLVAMTLARWAFTTRTQAMTGAQYNLLDSVF
jgi:hypothetical protein